MRRVNFITVFWGETYRRRFLDLCLSSLCSASSLEAVDRSAGHRFVILCGLSDWEAISSHPLVVLLGQHFEVVWLELRMPMPDWLGDLWRREGSRICGYVTDEPSADDFLYGTRLDQLCTLADNDPASEPVDRYKLVIYGMSRGHLKALDFIGRNGGGASFLAPDMVLNAGAMRIVIGQVKRDVSLVVAAANRFTYSAVEDLKIHGYLQAGAPSDLPARELVHYCFSNPHPETRAFEFERPDFCQVPTCMSFRLPHDGGVVMHSMFWAPLYIAEDVLERVDRPLLARGGTVDGRFLAEALDLEADRIHVVQDSDELFLASFTEAETYGYPEVSAWYKKQPPLSTLYKSVSVHVSLYGPNGDALKRYLYRHPIVFHAGNATPLWRRVLQRAEKNAARATGQLGFFGHLILPFVLLTRPDRANLRLTDYGLFRAGRVFRISGEGLVAKLAWGLRNPRQAISVVRRKWSAA
jgi:hypothetical protein